ncbi:MAG: hypothetical protein RL516_940 [Bacteroidota bacterium]|jgi:hypothetical protein
MIFKLISFLYNYCTDFVINLANFTELSYYEINFILFCVVYPGLIVGMPITLFLLKHKLNKIKTQNS